jgi:hypothetical protein
LITGIILSGVAGCQSDRASRAGVIPQGHSTFSEAFGAAKSGLSLEWLRLNPEPGPLLSADEDYLRNHGRDIAAPANEKIPLWHRSFYFTETSIRSGPPMAPEQEYYAAQSYRSPASEEARVAVLLADLHRANARLSDYATVAERILDIEDKRIEAVHAADLTLIDKRDLEDLLAHSIGNRHAINFALKSVSERISSYAYAAKRARIDLPGASQHFNIDGQVTLMSHIHTRLAGRIAVLDQKITDILTLPTKKG